MIVAVVIDVMIVTNVMIVSYAMIAKIVKSVMAVINALIAI